MLVTHDRAGALDEERIVQHQELGVEDRREVPSGHTFDPGSDLFELLTRPLPGLVERRELTADVSRGDGEPDDLGPLNGHERRTNGDARRHADPGPVCRRVRLFHSNKLRYPRINRIWRIF